MKPELEKRQACALVDLERVRVSTGPVEGDHQLPDERLVQRMLLDERPELADDVRVPAGRERRVEAPLECVQVELLETLDGCASRRRKRCVDERRAAPQGKRRLVQLRGATRVTGPTCVREQCLELAGIDACSLEVEAVAGAAAEQLGPVGLQQRP